MAAVDVLPHPSWGDREAAPDWSGEWMQFDDGETAQIAVHASDSRTPCVPPGWRLVAIELSEEFSSQVFTYRRI